MPAGSPCSPTDVVRRRSWTAADSHARRSERALLYTIAAWAHHRRDPGDRGGPPPAPPDQGESGSRLGALPTRPAASRRRPSACFGGEGSRKNPLAGRETARLLLASRKVVISSRKVVISSLEMNVQLWRTPPGLCRKGRTRH